MLNMVEPRLTKRKHKRKFLDSADDTQIVEGQLQRPKSNHKVPAPSAIESVVEVETENVKKKRKSSTSEDVSEDFHTEDFHKMIEPETMQAAMKQEAIKMGKPKHKRVAENTAHEIFNKRKEDTPKRKNVKRMLETIAEKESGILLSKKSKEPKSLSPGITTTVPSNPIPKPPKPKTAKGDSQESYTSDRYPILQNEDLIQRFLAVSMTNNQKGRIRQVLKELLRGTSSAVLPDVISNKIQSILNSSQDLTDTDLRKIRILYNMLKSSLIAQKVSDVIAEKELKKLSKKKKRGDDENKEPVVVKDSEPVKKDTNVVKKGTDQKIRGPKRYVVFVGNLPIGINKDKVMDHFSDLKDSIKDVRIPSRGQEAKSAIAYVELADEPSFEMALSKHHSMMGSKRINVLYTTQQNSKISKAEAKSKAAKLVAMAKSGQLLGSIALKKKRSQRRKKMKLALKAESVS